MKPVTPVLPEEIRIDRGKRIQNIVAALAAVVAALAFLGACDADYLPVPPAPVDCPDVAPGAMVGVVAYVTCPGVTDVEGIEVVRDCRPYPADDHAVAWADCRIPAEDSVPSVHCLASCP